MLEIIQNPEVSYSVVPTVVIPFAVIGVVLSMIATFIAGLFGIQLKAEGPKKLLEVLLKPKILGAALLLNLLILGGVYSYRFVSSLPSLSWWLEFKNRNPVAVDRNYEATPLPSRTVALDSKLSKIASLDVLWQIQMPEGSFNGPLLSGSSLFIGSSDGYVYEYDQKSGEKIRQFYIGTYVTPSPLVWNNTLYVGEGVHTTTYARIYAFDLKSGKFIGYFNTKGHTEGNPRVYSYDGKDLLVFAGGRDGVYAVDPKTLQEVWHFKDVIHTDSEIGFSDGFLYFSSGMEKDKAVDGQKAIALDFVSGDLIWEADLAASGWNAPVFYQEHVCWGLGEIYLEKNFGQFACYNKYSGKSSLTINLDAPVVASPQLLDSSVFMADMRGNLCRLNIETVTRDWCIATQETAYTYATPLIDRSGDILFTTRDQGLWILDAESGEKKYSWMPKDEEQLKWSRPAAEMALTIEKDELYQADWRGTVLRKFKLVRETTNQEAKQEAKQETQQ